MKKLLIINIILLVILIILNIEIIKISVCRSSHINLALDTIVNSVQIDSIKLIIKEKDSTIVNIKNVIKDETEKVINLDDSATLELFKRLVSE